MDTYGLNDGQLLRAATVSSSSNANPNVGKAQTGHRAHTELRHGSAKCDRVTVSPQAKSLATDANSVRYTQRILELREAIGNNTLPIAPPQIAQTILADEIARLRTQRGSEADWTQSQVAVESMETTEIVKPTAPTT